MDIDFLEKKAAKIRSTILEATVKAGNGHIGGSFSCVDILVALYHGKILNINLNNCNDPNRDRFILSKGHAGIALYSILADAGFITKEDLFTYGENDTALAEHPDRRINGIEADTGSLGHGLGIGVGIALSGKIDKSNFKTVVLLGDGECNEGSVWEALMFAAHHQLSNLIAIIDRNRQMILGDTEEQLALEPLDKKFKSFGWEVKEIDGHSFDELLGVLLTTDVIGSQKPLAIIANTVKGKGVSFMENITKWHHGVPSGEELKVAQKELMVV